MRSLSIILDGSIKVINVTDGFEAYELNSGNHFGASDLLHLPDIDFYGNIHAGPKGAKILTVKYPD